MNFIEKELELFPIRKTIDVKWRDLDAYQHVHNATYILWAEELRIAYMRQIGLDVVVPKSQKINLILGSQTCKYINQLRFPDTVLGGCTVKEIGEFKILFEVKLYSQQSQKIVAIILAELVTYNYQEQKKVAIPKSFIEIIEKIEGKKVDRR